MAQKFRKNTFPRKSLRLMRRPERSSKVKSGAGIAFSGFSILSFLV